MAESGNKVIRVFLSSTFVDFQEERSLLVKQVFPSLRRRAKSRGVDIVDVDLRWGVTAEQTERGETLPLCLAEIDNCRPYFISLLGERYGWVPPADFYQPALLERQPWLKERMGGASVTELEILHGVLRNPEMAGHALFYLRDPAYAQAQPDAGWVAENPAEQQRLHALKEQIRASGFPVVEEGLATPQAIAERIEADLWEVIEREHPEQEPPDALQREGQRHSDYRLSRTGLYLGGEAAIEQLERWIAEGEQRILITGESGAGKSALIANWMEAHQRSAPQDLVHSHHLGCTNDASAVRPLLGRLIETASQLLAEEQRNSKPIEVPQDWWELVFKVGEVFALLSCWCERQGRRWILVLDGLDRLAEEDQQALPWIPTTIPPGIHVVASALDCQARTILQERQYRTHEIGPLGKAEQQQLIARYLSRYTKQLESGLKQKILKHPLAGSPLFLKVLLEELRQCAWYDTLAEQLEFYLAAERIDGLYAKVLERLENDGHGEASRKALTALWASRAGLSETELLAITGLAQLEWAPVDLALGEAFGRNGERIVFDHDYLKNAIWIRYLPGQNCKSQAHSLLADWFDAQDEWGDHKAEELPWQWQQAGKLEALKNHLLIPRFLVRLLESRGNEEVIGYWKNAMEREGRDIEILFTDAVEEEIEARTEDTERLLAFADQFADFLFYAGMYGAMLLRMATLSFELREQSEGVSEESLLRKLSVLASVHEKLGNYGKAEAFFSRALESHERLLGTEHSATLVIVSNLGGLYVSIGDYGKAEDFYSRVFEASERLLGPEHPDTLTDASNLGLIFEYKGEYKKAEALFNRALEGSKHLLGPEHRSTNAFVANLGVLYETNGDYEKAEAFYNRALEARERLLGSEHPDTLTTVNNLGGLYKSMGDYGKAEAFYNRALEARERLLGPEHPDTLTTVNNLGTLCETIDNFEQAEVYYSRCLEGHENMPWREKSYHLTTLANLGGLYKAMGEYGKAETFYNRVLEAHERLNGPEHRDTLTAVAYLGGLYVAMGEYGKAEAFYNRALEARERLLGPENPDTLTAVCNLGGLYKSTGDYGKAEAFYNRALEAHERLNGPEHRDTLTAVAYLGWLYQSMGDYGKAEAFYNRVLEAHERLNGPEHRDTLTAVADLGGLYVAIGEYGKAEAFYNRVLEARERLLGPEHRDTLTAVADLGWLYKSMGDYGKAEAFYKRELESQEYLFGLSHINTINALTVLGDLYKCSGSYDLAETFYSRALFASEGKLGPNHPKTIDRLVGLADLYYVSGQKMRVISLLNSALPAREAALGNCNPLLIPAIKMLG